jgi:hypothetical protein
MQNKSLQIIVGLLGFGLVVVLLFSAVSKSSVLDYPKSAVALLVTLKLISVARIDNHRNSRDYVSLKRNAKRITIGLVVSFLIPLGFLWFITHGVR